LKITVFCDMTPSVLVEIYRLLDESMLSIFVFDKDWDRSFVSVAGM